VREGEIIYMLPQASRPKAGQIGLALPDRLLEGDDSCVSEER
jgi:hypothetical protein